MTREETVKIVRIMVDSYPNYKPNDISETVDVWHMMLSDYDYNIVAMALKAYILSDTSGFAPSIGQLVDKIKSITIPQELNEMEAWSLVCDALSNSGYNYAEEYEKLQHKSVELQRKQKDIDLRNKEYIDYNDNVYCVPLFKPFNL